MNDYVINTTHFALFNTSGRVIFYSNQGIGYAYEIPCDFWSNFCFIYDTSFEPNATISVSNCHRIHDSLWNTVMLNLFNSCKFEKNLAEGFCFGLNYAPNFPVSTQVPEQFESYHLIAERFYMRSIHGPIFKSPTLADYRRFIRKKLPFIYTDGESDDYFYDYWD